MLVRTTRARIIRLRNDYKGIMSRIEKGLHAHHANIQSAGLQSSIQACSNSHIGVSGGASSPDILRAPFARVNSVVVGSPADAAGLRAGDRILSFGSVNCINHEKLTRVAAIVQESEGVRFYLAMFEPGSLFSQRSLSVQVLRNVANASHGTSEMQLSLTPRRDWGGRGLLGCRLVPI